MTSHTPSRILLALSAGLLGTMACSDTTLAPARPSLVPASLSKTDARAYDIIDLGTFGIGPTIALAIDKHETVLGRYTRADGAPRSFKWTEEHGFADLGEFEGHAFLVLNTNDHGLLNGSIFAGPGVQRAVAWLPGEGFVYLDGTNTGGTLGSNDRGAIAGTRTGIGTSAAFIWTQDAGVQLVPLAVDGRSIRASSGGDVNDDGAVAGTLTLRSITAGPNENRGYVWHATGGTTLIPPLGPAAVGVTFISEEGMVLGASETRLPLPGERRASPLASSPGDVPVHAWKWSADLGLVDLGTLGGKHSVAWHADRDGNVYGWASDATSVRHAVKWAIDGTVVDLGTLGGSTVIGGLNKHGVLTGWSAPATGPAHAVLFIPKKLRDD